MSSEKSKGVLKGIQEHWQEEEPNSEKADSNLFQPWGIEQWQSWIRIGLFSHSVVSNSLQPHGLQYARLPCPSASPGDCSNSSPLIFPSIRVFSNESVLLHIRQPKYRSFSFSISPSNEYSGLISFRMVWLDLLAVQGMLKSLLQHHSSKASTLRCSAFFQTVNHSIMSNFCDHIDCTLPDSSVHGIFQASILKWKAILFSRRSSRPRDWTLISRIVGGFFTIWAPREAQFSLWSNNTVE